MLQRTKYMNSDDYIKYKPNTKWPYIYENFTDGTIYFDSNQKTKAQLNIHLWGNKLHYISSAQKILEAETSGIIRVEIGGDAYIYNDQQSRYGYRYLL